MQPGIRSKAEAMRRYWDERAVENAVWFVDTSCDREAPDMEAFLATGRKVVDQALVTGPVQPRGRDLAVEIGPGLGRICAALSEHFTEVIGVDVSEEMVRRARELVGREGVRFEVGNGYDLSGVATASADFVITFTVFQHQLSPALVDGYIGEAARVLKPGGVLAAQWNNIPNHRLWLAQRALKEVRSRLEGGRGEIRDRRPFTGSRIPWARMERTVTASGLRVEATQGLGTLFAWLWATKPAA